MRKWKLAKRVNLIMGREASSEAPPAKFKAKVEYSIRENYGVSTGLP